MTREEEIRERWIIGVKPPRHLMPILYTAAQNDIDYLLKENERLRKTSETVAYAHVERVKYSEYLEDENQRLCGALEQIAEYKNGHALLYVQKIMEIARQALAGDAE